MHMDQCTGPASQKMDGLEQPKHSVWSRGASRWTIFPCSLVEVLRPWESRSCDGIWAVFHFSCEADKRLSDGLGWAGLWLSGQRFSVSSLWTISAKLVLATKSAEDFVPPWNQAQIMNSDFPKNYHVRLKARELPKWNQMPCVKELKDFTELSRPESKQLEKMSSNRREYKIEQPRDPHTRVEKMDWGVYWGVAEVVTREWPGNRFTHWTDITGFPKD